MQPPWQKLQSTTANSIKKQNEEQINITMHCKWIKLDEIEIIIQNGGTRKKFYRPIFM